MPKASVIIATYNWSSILPYSIASALEQTESDIEVLVVGDACTDDSEDVVRSIGESRVRWYNLPERCGHQSGPNNEALRRAESDFIFYLGHDDLWLPNHVSSYLEIFGKGADLVYGIVARIPKRGELAVATPGFGTFRRGMWIPPTGLAHRSIVSTTINGWSDYRDAAASPEIDLVNRSLDAGFDIQLCPRLTAIKLPAAVRPGVYLTKPSDEQAEWLNRIRTEPSLEANLLAALLTDTDRRLAPKPVAVETVLLLKKIVARLKRRLTRDRTPRERIDARKRLKGSDP